MNRDSELAQIPSHLLHYLKRNVPQVLTRIIQLLSDKLLGNMTNPSNMAQSLVWPLLHMTGEPPNSMGSNVSSEGSQTIGGQTNMFCSQLNSGAMSNLRTIAILPTTSDINTEAFALELQHSMCPFGSTVRLTSRKSFLFFGLINQTRLIKNEDLIRKYTIIY